MGIPSMTDKVSSDDIEKMRNRHNPPENESYFDDGEDEYVEDDSEFFGGSSSNSGGDSGDSAAGGGFSSEGFSSGGFGQGGFGQGSFGQGGFGQGGFGNPPAPQESKQDWTEQLVEYSVDGFKQLFALMKDTFGTLKTKTVDDWALYSTNDILVGMGGVGIGIFLWLVGLAYSNQSLSFWHLPATCIGAGLLVGAYGLVGIGVSTFQALRIRGVAGVEVEDLDNIESNLDVGQEEYEERSAELFDDLLEQSLYEDDDEDEDDSIFGDFDEPSDEDDDDVFGTFGEDDTSTNNTNSNSNNEPEKIQRISESLSAVPTMTREVLMNNLLQLFPYITPEFNKKSEVDKDSDEFLAVEALAIKALANAVNKDESEIESGLETLVKNSYSMELKVKRVRGLNKLDAIVREMTAYFRNGVNDTSVQCTADIDGDFYKIIVSFGNSSIVGMRDVLSLPDVDKYYRDKSHALPFIACLDSLGNPVLTDAKTIDTMLIAGKPRSGKSWYVLSVILSLMAFNSPEEVQFLIIDPKESNLFKEVALLPHVCGLHNDAKVIEILRDIIANEGARRKRLLADNRCENVWDLRKKGVTIPILYIVIDEVMTIKGNLAENFKEFLSVISTVVTQLPSQGIRLMMVPHRSKGVIDPSIRTNISFTAAVRADTEIIKETLDIKSWDRPLLNPGELAVKITGIPNALYGRSIAITSTDFDNSELIRELARSFYKMGVELPDMSGLGIGYNRDNDFIKEELSLGGGNRIQFDANELRNADTEIDLNSV